MLRSNRSRILLLTTVFLVGMLFGVSTHSPTDALAATNATYYNNAQHTTIVGKFGYDCCNNRVAWGVKTKFVTYGGCFLCVPPPPR